MSEYLSNLIAKHLQTVEVIQPRRASRFESAGVEGGIASLSNRVEENAPGIDSPVGEEESRAMVRSQEANDELLSSRLSRPAMGDASLSVMLMRASGTEQQRFREDDYPAKHSSVPSADLTTAKAPAANKGVEKPPQNDQSYVVQISPAAIEGQASEGPIPLLPVASATIFNRLREVSRPRSAVAHEGEHPGFGREPRETTVKPPSPGLQTVQPTSVTAPSPRAERREPTVPSLSAAASAPTIKVTIGRIDVRAVMPGAPVASTPAVRQSSRLSLTDYLKHSNRGRR